MAIEYLVINANDLYQLLSKGDPTPNDLANAASIACSTLSRVAEDTQFRRNAEQLGQWWQVNRSRVREVMSDIDNFNSFLETERRLMIRGGLEPPFIDELIKQGEQALKSNKWQGDVKTLFLMVNSASREACTLARELAQNVKQIEQDQKRKRQRQSILIRATYAVAGGAIIGINAASSTGVHPILDPVSAALSGGMGSALMSAAAPPPLLAI